MKRVLSVLGVLVAMALAGRAAVGAPAGQPASDESTKATAARMEVWNGWKFGLFIHWGPWSLSERGPIWDMMKEFTPEEREKAFDYFKTFNPVKYDPKEWARIAKEAGMRYAVLVTKHHDGFCNFDTKETDFKITNPACPYSQSPHPDIVGEYAKAFREAGIAVGLYYSHIDWRHPDGVWQVSSHNYVKDFVAKYPERWENFARFEKSQVSELLSNYGKIDILWFDIFWPAGGFGKEFTDPVVRKDALDMGRMMREQNSSLIINNRGTDIYGDFETPEQYIPGQPPGEYWETNMTISNGRGFWYKGPDATYKSTDDMIQRLCDIASKGGNLLLDIGPKPDGTIAQQEVDTLLGMGKWLEKNGESIYGTKRNPWGDAPAWGRITRKGQRLYAIVFEWPKEGALPFPLKASQVARAKMLIGGEAVSFTPTAAGDAIELYLPGDAPTPPATVIEIEMSGDLDAKELWTKPVHESKSSSKDNQPSKKTSVNKSK